MVFGNTDSAGLCASSDQTTAPKMRPTSAHNANPNARTKRVRMTVCSSSTNLLTQNVPLLDKACMTFRDFQNVHRLQHQLHLHTTGTGKERNPEIDKNSVHVRLNGDKISCPVHVSPFTSRSCCDYRLLAHVLTSQMCVRTSSSPNFPTGTNSSSPPTICLDSELQSQGTQRRDTQTQKKTQSQTKRKNKHACTVCTSPNAPSSRHAPA